MFSEFSILDFCFFTFGEMNLDYKLVSCDLGLVLEVDVPRLSPYGLEGNRLNEYAYDHLAQ